LLVERSGRAAISRRSELAGVVHIEHPGFRLNVDTELSFASC
jgi:hypothetical protein